MNERYAQNIYGVSGESCRPYFALTVQTIFFTMSNLKFSQWQL